MGQIRIPIINCQTMNAVFKKGLEKDLPHFRREGIPFDLMRELRDKKVKDNILELKRA